MKLTDNTLKYLKEYGGLSFGERPFSHVDSLILCQLSYFKFQDLVPDLVEKMDGNDIRGVTMRSLRKHPKYNSLYVSDWYEKDKDLKAAVDFIVGKDMMKIGQKENLKRLYKELLNKDWFMTFPDFEDYVKTREEAYAAYTDRTEWAKKMLINISKAGFFSSDRTIAQYNEDIWHL